MDLKNRITGLTTVPAKSLAPHPDNIRLHPPHQVEQVRGLMDEVGWVKPILVYPHGDGWRILDGHLRANLDPEADVPVLTTDLNEAEADLLLATLDASGLHVDVDLDAWQRLLPRVDGPNASLRRLIADIGRKAEPPPVPTKPISESAKERNQRDTIADYEGIYDDVVIVFVSDVSTTTKLSEILNIDRKGNKRWRFIEAQTILQQIGPIESRA